jgi:hypothetical protein
MNTPEATTFISQIGRPRGLPPYLFRAAGQILRIGSLLAIVVPAASGAAAPRAGGGPMIPRRFVQVAHPGGRMQAGLELRGKLGMSEKKCGL